MKSPRTGRTYKSVHDAALFEGEIWRDDLRLGWIRVDSQTVWVIDEERRDHRGKLMHVSSFRKDASGWRMTWRARFADSAM